MPKCTADQMGFGRLGRRVVEANFEGGALSSDGGLMLVRQTDRKIGLSAAVAAALSDPRDPERIRHPLRDLIAQRLYGLCCGYEDLKKAKGHVLTCHFQPSEPPVHGAPSQTRYGEQGN